ncbi:Kinesin-like protein [Sesbania bispinosa]|nr:Kinesin-like protein [Sesbania bispinosa]
MRVTTSNVQPFWLATEMMGEDIVIEEGRRHGGDDANLMEQERGRGRATRRGDHHRRTTISAPRSLPSEHAEQELRVG